MCECKPLFQQEAMLFWPWPQSAVNYNFLLQISNRGRPAKPLNFAAGFMTKQIVEIFHMQVYIGL